MPASLPRVDYDEHEIVRTVGTAKTYVSFKGRLWKVPQAFRGARVAIRPRGADSQYGVFFGSREIAQIGGRRFLRERSTALSARIAKCLNARPASRTTSSPLCGKSLTPTSRSNQGHPSDQGLLTVNQKVSAMSPNGCPPCPRTKHLSRPSR